jgi:hemoglobin-like flavoprotein
MFGCCASSATISPGATGAPPGGMPAGERKLEYLKDEEKTIIENSWNTVKEAKLENELGEQIFKKFFELDPDALQLFITFSDNDNIYESYAFKHHCEIFAFHIGLGVKHVKNNDKLIAFLTQLGKLHDNIFQIRENYGAEDKKNHARMEEHFNISEKALQLALKEVLKDKFTEQLGTTWQHFYKLMCDILMNHIEVCNRPKA